MLLVTDIRFQKGYKDQEALRKSFFQLAADTFGIHFEQWYEKGFWNDRYIPYSFVEGDRVIANVSVNLLDLILDGERKRAIQIGTVMTHPDYRKQGLSAKLMNRVLAAYENQYDFMYLFANETVLDFYPRFGFQPVEECLFTAHYAPPAKGSGSGGVRKLDVKKEADLRLLSDCARERVPVSNCFGTLRAEGIFMFYALQVFSDDLYYLEEEDVVVICKQEGNRLELFDLLSRKPIRVRDILGKMAGDETEQVVFHFTPDVSDLSADKQPCSSGLFVIATGDNKYPEQVKHPLTSIA